MERILPPCTVTARAPRRGMPFFRTRFCIPPFLYRSRFFKYLLPCHWQEDADHSSLAMHTCKCAEEATTRAALRSAAEPVAAQAPPSVAVAIKYDASPPPSFNVPPPAVPAKQASPPDNWPEALAAMKASFSSLLQEGLADLADLQLMVKEHDGKIKEHDGKIKILQDESNGMGTQLDYYLLCHRECPRGPLDPVFTTPPYFLYFSP